MFGLFEKSRMKKWEIQLLKNALKQLPVEFSKLEKQVNARLIKGCTNNSHNPPGYVTFYHNSKIIPLFMDIAEKAYRITGIKVYDKKSLSQLLYTVYVSSGIINGYSVKGADNYSLDVESADASWYVKILEEDNVLTTDSIPAISNIVLAGADKLHEMVINGTTYYHLIDFNGNAFLGIDSEKNVFRIKRGTLEITPVNYEDLPYYLPELNLMNLFQR